MVGWWVGWLVACLLACLLACMPLYVRVDYPFRWPSNIQVSNSMANHLWMITIRYSQCMELELTSETIENIILFSIESLFKPIFRHLYDMAFFFWCSASGSQYIQILPPHVFRRQLFLEGCRGAIGWSLPGSKCQSYGATATANSGGLCGAGLSLWATSNVPLAQEMGPGCGFGSIPVKNTTSDEIFGKLQDFFRKFEVPSTKKHQPSICINLIISIHKYGIFTYIYIIYHKKHQLNVGKYTVRPMDGTGRIVFYIVKPLSSETKKTSRNSRSLESNWEACRERCRMTVFCSSALVRLKQAPKRKEGS